MRFTQFSELGRKRKSAEIVLPLHSADFPRDFEAVLKVLPIASKNKPKSLRHRYAGHPQLTVLSAVFVLGLRGRSFMQKRSFVASFLAAVALLGASLPAVSADTPSIVSVSAPPDSSDLYAWAFDTGIYSITFPIKDREHVGIGYVVEPEPFHRTWSPMTDFVMHDHVYVAPGVPDPRRANITYRFDAPAKISEVLIVQHTNGIAQVEGFIGDDEKQLKSIGLAHSTLGANLPLGENAFAEGYRDVFKFERAGEGKVFRVVITKTPLPNGYAVYRVYPRNSDHRPYDVLRSD